MIAVMYGLEMSTETGAIHIAYPSGDSTNWNSEFFYFTPIPHEEHGLAPGHWTLRRRVGDRHVNTYMDALWRPVLEESLDATDIGGTLSQVVKRYDNSGQLVFQSYPKRGVTRQTESQGVHTIYDALGRATSVSQNSELGLLTTLTEYLPGFQMRVTNPRGFQTLTEFQAFDQPATEFPTGITQFAGVDTSVTEIHRDIFGKPTRIRKRNASGSLFVDRHYVYDTTQQLCKAVEPETGATIMDYDGAGNLQWSASGLHNLIGTTDCDTIAGRDSGRKVTRYYDARNRLSSLHFLDGRGNQSWEYWPDGLPKRVETHNSSGGSDTVYNQYAYNRRRLIESEYVQNEGGAQWLINYGYDGNGSRASQSYPSGLIISYLPNALGQAREARDQSGYAYVSGATYYPNGALSQFTYANGVVHSMSQNARQLPASTVDDGVSGFNYAYDQNGNTRMIDDTVRGVNYLRYMYYDGIDRLVRATSISFGPNGEHTYSYDAIDNLKSSRLIGVRDYANYVYDSRNQVVNIKDSTDATVVSLEYDEQGNVRNKNGVAHYFDYGNRLREISGKEGYRYDAQGRRLLAWSPVGGGIWTQYGIDGQQVYLESERTGNKEENIFLAGSIVATRVWNPATSYSAKFHHTDALGSPVAVTNQAGVVIERNDYEPYGAMIGKPNYQGIGYTGHVQDGATGLTYMQQRYYDPTVGRFLSVDPVNADSITGALFNRYMYAANNPYRFFDPDGRCTGSRIENDDGTCKSTGGYTTQSGPVYSTVPAAPTVAQQSASAPPAAERNVVIERLGLSGDLTKNGNILDMEALGHDLFYPLMDSPEGAPIKAGGLLIVKLGRVGEDAVRAAYNIGDRGFFRAGLRMRFPDGMTRTTMSEIKNVQSLSYTRQLRDYAAFARSTGRRFDLYVRPSTMLSGPLVDAVKAGDISLKFIP